MQVKHYQFWTFQRFRMRAYFVLLLVIFLVTKILTLKLDQIRLPSSQHVKYMPMGHDKVVPCPAPSQSSSGAGKTRMRWIAAI